MNLTPCPGCDDAAFDLHLTAYGLCQSCEAQMEPTLELVVIFPDEVIRVNADCSDLMDAAMLIGDVEADDGTFVWQSRMILRRLAPKPEATLI